MKIKKVLFTENSISNINKIINEHEFKTEIGGALVGYQKEDKLIVTHASNPGNDSKMSFDSIEIDGKHVTRFCNRLNELSNYRLYYIGDWHTHLSNNLRPSERDLTAIKQLSNYLPKQYRNSLITIIVNHYKPSRIAVYSLNNFNELKALSNSVIPNPIWISKYI